MYQLEPGHKVSYKKLTSYFILFIYSFFGNYHRLDKIRKEHSILFNFEKIVAKLKLTFILYKKINFLQKLYRIPLEKL